MLELNTLQLIAVWALPIIFAVTVHEASHGYVANYFGDHTAKNLGRLTLSPHKHIDPLGTIFIPGLLIAIGAPFIFGWAKPVPVSEKNLKNPRSDMAIIALAGPLSNLFMAVIWAALSKLALYLEIGWISTPLYLMGLAGIQINLILMLLNILPIPPLDGSKVLNNFLRGRAAILYDKIEPYGFFILLFLLVTHTLNFILTPVFGFCTHQIYNIFNLYTFFV
jgi:Zn-dependent protease